MQKLLSQGSTPTILSTHPATGDRIKALQKAIDPNRVNIGDGLNNGLYQQQMRQFSGS
jgi:predicted Zn-dependent protease